VGVLEKSAGTPEGFSSSRTACAMPSSPLLNINAFARHADRVRSPIAQMVNVLQAMIFTRRN
jgi:hypothetical protein